MYSKSTDLGLGFHSRILNNFMLKGKARRTKQQEVLPEGSFADQVSGSAIHAVTAKSKGGVQRQ